MERARPIRMGIHQVRFGPSHFLETAIPIGTVNAVPDQMDWPEPNQEQPAEQSSPADFAEVIRQLAAVITDAETEAPPWKTPSSPPAGWEEAIRELVAATAGAETEVPPWKKRSLTCLLAMHMPAEGVDENLEAALDCWNFYADRPTAPTIPRVPPSTETVKVVGVRTSPGMTFEG